AISRSNAARDETATDPSVHTVHLNDISPLGEAFGSPSACIAARARLPQEGLCVSAAFCEAAPAPGGFGAFCPTSRNAFELPASLRARHPPHGIRQVVGDDQRAARVDGHPDGAPASLAVVRAEAGDEVDRRSRRGAIAEGYEDHLVAHRILAVPAAVLADEHTLD